MSRKFAYVSRGFILFVGIISALMLGFAVPVQAHSGVRFCLTSTSEAATRVYYHGVDGIERSSLVYPGKCIVYPAGGHLTKFRMAAGWYLTGVQNGKGMPQKFCGILHYCYYSMYGTYSVAYWH